MNPTTLDHYRRARRADRWTTARHAHAVAKMRCAAAGFWNAETEGDECAAAEWFDAESGYTIRAAYTFDDYPDLSWLGEWTDNPDGAIENPGAGRGEYRYFRPGNPGDAEYPYFRAAGYTRAEARERCAELDRDAMRQARTTEDYYVVTVTASLAGRTLGYASLSGCYDAEYGAPYLADVARELATEAAHDANRTLARKLGTAAEVIA